MAGALLNILIYIAKFIKEMFIGDDDITKFARKHSVATLLFFANILLFAALVYIFSQTVDKHWAIVNLTRENTELSAALEVVTPYGSSSYEDFNLLAKHVISVELERDQLYDRLVHAHKRIVELEGTIKEMRLVCLGENSPFLDKIEER